MQAAIDSAKRSFDIDITGEIKRIRNDMDIDNNKYPAFWLEIRRGFPKEKINHELSCPMNDIYNIKLPSYNPQTTTIPTTEFIRTYKCSGSNLKTSKKVGKWISDFSVDLFKSRLEEDNEEYLLLRSNFEDMLNEIRKVGLSKKYLPIMSYLINQAFQTDVKNSSKLHKNRALMLRILYEIDPSDLLLIFSKDTSNWDFLNGLQGH